MSYSNTLSMNLVPDRQYISLIVRLCLPIITRIIFIVTHNTIPTKDKLSMAIANNIIEITIVHSNTPLKIFLFFIVVLL